MELLKPFDQLVADICSVLNEDRSEDRFLNAWTNLRSFVDKIKFRETLRLFNETGATQSELWSYWNIFLDAIMPVVIDLTRSFRDANWKLHLSAIRRAMPLLFAFCRTNYCRWLPIYYEDCLSLKSNFPLLWESFKKGDFVVHHTRRQGSGVPIDQALEKEYNKPAEGAGGIIGFIRKNESVAKWNIVKHEKEKFTKFIDDVCEGEDVGEYSLHREFSRLRTAKDEEDIKLMKDFIVGRCDITKPGKLINMVTGSVLSDDNKISLLTCIEKGEDLYQEYRNTQLIQKKTKLFDTLSLKTLNRKKMGSRSGNVDLTKLQSEFVRAIDVARSRGYCMKTLFTYEIVNNSYFLMDKGFLTKSNKSDLLGLLRTRQIPVNEFDFSSQSQIIIIDFMAQARKIEPERKKGGIKTFGDAIIYIRNLCWKMAVHSQRIDVIFDLYCEDSIKGLERKRRANNESIRTVISHMDQPLPIPSEFCKFWALNENKVGFQQFFISYVQENYKGIVPLYLGCSNGNDRNGCIKVVNGTSSSTRILKCSFDEADDRLMYHLNHAVKADRFKVAHVMTSDTDIFVNLMYHLRDWKTHGLDKVWFHSFGNVTPLHEAGENLPSNVVYILPTVHALSDCDTTSKIGTKMQAFKAAFKSEYSASKDFGISPLENDTYIIAEHFLLECISRVVSRSEETFNDLRYSRYHSQNYKLDLNKFPCTSNSLRFHIQRAYFQCRLWILSATIESIDLDPVLYGYTFDDSKMLISVINDGIPLPEDFPAPCACLKCARGNICPCRVLGIECCDICKCHKKCKNPKNMDK